MTTIRRAAGVAKFNGWATALAAALSAPFALSSAAGLLMTGGLSVIAYNEFQGRKRLLKFDSSAAARLGWNQLALLALIVAYCMWMLALGLTGPTPLTAELQAQTELEAVFGSFADLDELYHRFALALYGAIGLACVVVQGANALYYFTRRKHVEAHVRETPPWVLDVQRTTTPA